MGLLQLGKEIPLQTIKDIASSNMASGDGNGHAFSELISDWKRELEVKSCQLKEKATQISSLEVQLQSKDEEIFEVRERCASVEKDRDGNCQTVSKTFFKIEYKFEWETYCVEIKNVSMTLIYF